MKHMRTPLSPWGILLGHTLPSAILLSLYASMLSVVHPLLSAESLHQWWFFGGVLVAVTTLSTVYALFQLSRGRVVHVG